MKSFQPISPKFYNLARKAFYLSLIFCILAASLLWWLSFITNPKLFTPFSGALPKAGETVNAEFSVLLGDVFRLTIEAPEDLLEENDKGTCRLQVEVDGAPERSTTGFKEYGSTADSVLLEALNQEGDEGQRFAIPLSRGQHHLRLASQGCSLADQADIPFHIEATTLRFGDDLARAIFIPPLIKISLSTLVTCLVLTLFLGAFLWYEKR